MILNPYRRFKSSFRFRAIHFFDGLDRNLVTGRSTTGIPKAPESLALFCSRLISTCFLNSPRDSRSLKNIVVESSATKKLARNGVRGDHPGWLSSVAWLYSDWT